MLALDRRCRTRTGARNSAPWIYRRTCSPAPAPRTKPSRRCPCSWPRRSRRAIAGRSDGARSGPWRSRRTYDGVDSIRHLTNFGRSVLGCIEAYDSETRRIFQHFSKSTRCAFLCTTRNSIFCKKNRLFFLQILLFIAVKPDFMTNFLTNFDEILTNFDEILTNGDLLSLTRRDDMSR